MSLSPPPLVVDPRGPVRGTVIFLHGLGADGHDFSDFPRLLGLSGIRYVFPHAPVRRVTLNGGIPMRAWFDIARLGPDAGVGREGLEESVTEVGRLLEAERTQGIAPEKVVLGGFSQGGAVALYGALGRGWPLAGIAALSTFLPALPPPPAEGVPLVPVFLAHGTSDTVVDPRLGEETRERLRARGHEVVWWTHGGAHTVDLDEIRALADWIGGRLEPVGVSPEG